MEVQFIEPRLAKLLKLCLEHIATYLTQEDTSLAWVTDLLPKEVRVMIEENLPLYAPISVYFAPHKEGDDHVYILVVGHKDERAYSLSSGAIPKGDFKVCIDLLREAAQKRMQPWNYWEPGKRIWTIAAGVVSAATLTLAAYLYIVPPSEVSNDILFFLIGAELFVGFALSSALFILPVSFWNDRARDIEMHFDAIPA